MRPPNHRWSYSGELSATVHECVLRQEGLQLFHMCSCSEVKERGLNTAVFSCSDG